MCAALLQFHEKPKGADGGEQAEELLELARDSGALMGVLAREKTDGGLATVWHERTTSAGVSTVDVAPALARVMAPKDDGELLAIKRAAHLSTAVLEKCVVHKIELVVDEEGKVRLTGSATFWLLAQHSVVRIVAEARVVACTCARR